MKNNKGFTLMELIVVITILSALAMVMVPALTQYIINAQKGVCESSREEFMHSFRTFKATDESGLTLEQAINGDIPELAENAERLKCPSGGEFSVVNGEIHCSIHDDEGEAEESGRVPGTTILGNIVLDDLAAVCTLATKSGSGGIHLTATGQVFVANNVTYAVGWNTWLSISEAQAYLDNGTIPSILVEIDTINVLTNNDEVKNLNFVNYHWVFTPEVHRGSVYYENGVSYYFIGTSGATDQPPWLGGNWIKLS